jgi:ABC-type multidrug transport system ATPase subunit
VDEIESFYCHLSSCGFDRGFDHGKNSTKYTCEHIDCRCIKDEMLCGKDGSIDLTDLLRDEIKGPASFNCVGPHCAFSEPAMDDLISAVFGDDSIFLDCNGGECLHYTMVPGFERPERQTNWIMIISGVSGVAAFLVIVSGIVTYFARKKGPEGVIEIADDEAGKLMSEHTPASLIFEDINYQVGSKTILEGATGMVQPGQVMAIMGPSGAGKTTLLDILAKRTKSGTSSGTLLVNGHQVSSSHYKKLIGYVDQEEVMIPTLTVYETILYSALLRLPRSMSQAAKKFRVMEVMQELGIDTIKDAKIGQPGARSISGGERRRVAIACELVTSPSILFLDEPTSGLDAYNAFNVVASLTALARNYRRTVVFTIHQPRSNIVTLFDQLVLVASGRIIYSGPQSQSQNYFKQIGYPCPSGFNIADYMIDLTMGAIRRTPKQPSSIVKASTMNESFASEDGFFVPPTTAELPSQPTSIFSDELENTTEQWASELNRDNKRTARKQQQPQAAEGSTTAPNIVIEQAQSDGLPSHLRQLVEYYQHSIIANALRENIQTAITQAQGDDGDDSISTKSIVVHKRPGPFAQFQILADRTFKNLYRNPMLMFSHYAMAVILACM